MPGFSWAFVDDQESKSPGEIQQIVNDLVDGIVDVTSKNGVTLMGVAPKADGTLPVAQVEVLKKLGAWMRVNKAALQGAAWREVCELVSLRFTVKGDYLYAIDRETPKKPEVIPGVTPVPGSTIQMLGSDQDLAWHQDGENLVIDELPDPLPCDYSWVFRIRRPARATGRRRPARVLDAGGGRGALRFRPGRRRANQRRHWPVRTGRGHDAVAGTGGLLADRTIALKHWRGKTTRDFVPDSRTLTQHHP